MNQRKTIHQLKQDNLIICYCIFLSSISIAASTYVGLNGWHVWRQSDVYSQILGFMNANGISMFTDFFGQRALYDMPIYQGIVSLLSVVTRVDPLATTRILNVFIWCTLVTYSSLFSERAQPNSSKYVAFFMSTCPLYLHYFSTPLPDILSLTLSMAGLYIAFTRQSYRQGFIAIACFALASFIKSPVPFIFLIFYFLMEILGLKKENIKFNLLIGLTSFASAVFSEIIRKLFYSKHGGVFAQDPSWYFGDIKLRTSTDFWLRFFKRSLDDSFGNRYFALVVGTSLMCVFFKYKVYKSSSFIVIICAIITVLGGWLTFSNLYYKHDYYQLPVVTFIIICCGTIIGFAEEKIKLFSGKVNAKSALVVGIYITTPILLVYGSSKRDLGVATQADALAVLVRDRHEIALVDANYSAQFNDPSFGGRLGRIFQVIEPTVLEQDCKKFAYSFDVIILRAEVACEDQLKEVFQEYVRVGEYQVFLR